VGEPLQWSDIIPGWFEDAEADAGSPPASAAASGTERAGFPAGSAWASFPAGVSAVPVATAGSDVDPPDSAPRTFATPPAAGDPNPVAPASGLLAGVSHPGVSAPNSVEAERQPADRILTPDDFGGATWEIVSPTVADQPRPRGSQASLAPPAWVLPEQPDDLLEDPLARLGVSESWSAPPGALPDENELSVAGAFGGHDDRRERRMGLRAFDPGRRGVRVLAVIAVLVIVVAAFLAWRARPRVDPVATPSFGTDAGAATDGPAAPSPAASAEVIVAVEGKVQKPGVVHLPSGSRVADALEAAGGAKPGVDVAMLNLARKVVDGELILVGVTPSPGMSMPAPPAAGGPAGGLVNLNTATLADLDTLPGVGPVLAQRILDARTAQGGFKAVSDLRKVNGIGDARYEQLKDLVTV
jgi:competence protein ComEA